MGATTDREVGADAPLRAVRVAVVCADPVTRMLALRMVERLGLPAAQLCARLADALQAPVSTILIDEGDLPPDAGSQLAAAVIQPCLILMSALDGPIPAGVHTRLRKPLVQAALAAALEAGGGRNTDRVFDPAIWDELLQLFGRDGVAEMLAALQRDLPQQRQNLGTALAAQDRLAIKRIAHSLRGVALQFGAAQLAGEFAALEQSAAADTPVAELGSAAAILLDRQAALIRQLEDALRGD